MAGVGLRRLRLRGSSDSAVGWLRLSGARPPLPARLSPVRLRRGLLVEPRLAVGRRDGRVPAALVEQRLQHRAEILAALRSQLVGEPLDRRGAPARDLLRDDVVHAREGLIGHASAKRQGKQLPLPRIQALEGAGELFRRDHATIAKRTDGIGAAADGIRAA